MQNFKQLLILTVGLATSTFSIAQTMQIAPSWTGLYNDEQKISLFFQQKGTDVSGYSLLNGKQTNFKGKIQQTDLNYTLTLNEVGQGADIGKFILEFKNNATPIEAQWLPISK
ncbi:MAG TPA: YARHG domain-containing protein, partial [Acinetobacter sp.]|nr:YARHG domain-containing protein [Acinetobacter sp.]